jgi:hypothetical protein
VVIFLLPGLLFVNYTEHYSLDTDRVLTTCTYKEDACMSSENDWRLSSKPYLQSIPHKSKSPLINDRFPPYARNCFFHMKKVQKHFWIFLPTTIIRPLQYHLTNPIQKQMKLTTKEKERDSL